MPIAKRVIARRPDHEAKLVYNQGGDTRMADTRFRVVLVTCGTLEESRKIARDVVEKHLAACVNVVTHAVESFYTWEGKLEDSSEYLLMMKTSEDRVEELQREVLELHSYDTPEFVVLPIVAGSQAYLKWVGESVEKA
jgi:periplasmic divalent cation tolerance protein